MHTAKCIALGNMNLIAQIEMWKIPHFVQQGLGNVHFRLQKPKQQRRKIVGA